jgi:hypothetical protein
LQTFITNIVAISHRYLTSKISIWMIDLLEKNHIVCKLNSLCLLETDSYD